MNLFEDTTPKPPKQLLGEIDACEAALPDFTLDFVWEPSATTDASRAFDLSQHYLAIHTM